MTTEQLQLQQICQVCEEQKECVNYKCPKCKIRYCGVDCFKKHDPTSCEVRNQATSSTQECSSISATSSKLSAEEEEEEEEEGEELLIDSNVPKRNLNLLAQSPEICQLLSDPKLRTLILNVDSTANPNDALNNAMKDKYFQQFAAACLDIVKSGEAKRSKKVSEMSNEELIEVWRQQLENIKS